MSVIPQLARLAIEQARRGDLRKALTLAEQALAEHPQDHGLMMFVGSLHARRMEIEEAATHFRSALRIAPADPLARLELARMLIGLNQLDEAQALLESAPLPGPERRRLQAMILMRRGDYRAASELYQQIVSDDPRDFESWGNFGVSRLRSGDSKAAVDALTTSLNLRPDQQRFHDQWAEAHIAAGTGSEALGLARTFAGTNRDNIPVRVTIARLEDMLGRPEAALAALQEVIERDADYAPALLALARLHERENRLDDFAAAVTRLETLGEPAAELPLLKAQLLFRRGEFQQALELARSAPANIDPGARAELLGRIHDRLGNSAEAFAAFAEMNRDTGLTGEVAEARARAFSDRLAANSRLLSKSWVKGWSKATPAAREPAFILSFPRSGTTLLDTLLMGHPGLFVAEEKPMLDRVAQRVGGQERLAGLRGEQLDQLRQLYFHEAAAQLGDLDDRLVVDKQPFATVEVPLIHRLFPTGKLVFVERHPCDVVLSCFMTRFEPNPGLLNFTTLEGAARIYDAIMSYWLKCRELLPLAVHELRYERLVADVETEMRSLVQFLGLDWAEGMLDHSSTAVGRRFINTPSYSQVVEPLYQRSIGRWERYREQMEPVLPLLEPWIKRMGYRI